jgi:Ca2+-binding RTX toxin-like protein
VPEQAARFSFADTSDGVTGVTPGTAYVGPVGGLQWQYIWPSSDSAVLSGLVGNVFLKGGSGDDALTVAGGNNVLDGGAGSNFLVGGAGNDTFYGDARGGQISWSTIVNFHLGDSATIWGFNPGVSTVTYADDQGVSGFTGLTLHSEVNGPGTGVTASLTFAGLDAAAASQHFTISSGTAGAGTPNATNYLLIQYDH